MGGRGKSSGYAGGGSSGGSAPVGTPQNPAPNGYTGTVSGRDISGTWQPPANGTMADQIESVMDAQGFRGKPKLISDQAEFDKAAQAAWGGNGMVMVRGIGAPDDVTLDAYSKTLTDGTWYVQCNGGAVHGMGQYAAYSYGVSRPSSADIQTAKNYAQWNGKSTKVFTMTLDPSARIIEESKLRQEMNAHNNAARQVDRNYRSQRQKAGDAIASGMASSKSRGEAAAAKAWMSGNHNAPPRGRTTKYISDYRAAMSKFRAAADKVKKPKGATIFRDLGVFGTSKGYDFYYDRGTGYSVTLNRTKLIIKV